MLSKIRNNPKKTIFFTGLVAYGGYFLNEKYKNYELRRQFCAKAKILGDTSIPSLKELTKVTVIHNPYANNRNCKDNFNKNVFPLLNLSGYKVTVVETDKAEEAKELMSVVKPDDQDCIYIAGGDGTLMEIVTGLLRRADLRDQIHKFPLIVAPLGLTNSSVRKLFNNQLLADTKEQLIRACNESVNLIQKNRIKPVNVLAIRTIPEQESENETYTTEKSEFVSKEVYAISGLDWSIDREVQKKGKRKWLFGPFRQYFQYTFTGLLGKHRDSNKTATLIYQEPCEGCSNCAHKILSDGKAHRTSKSTVGSIGRFMFPMFFKETITKEKETALELREKSQIVNSRCGEVHEKKVCIRGLSVILEEGQLKVKIVNQEPKLIEYIRSGIDKLKEIPYDSSNACDETFTCTELRIIPETKSTEKFYIDNEELEVLPIEIKVLKDALYFYS